MNLRGGIMFFKNFVNRIISFVSKDQSISSSFKHRFLENVTERFLTLNGHVLHENLKMYQTILIVACICKKYLVMPLV